MSLSERAGYALAVTIVATAAVSLAVAVGSADAIALLPPNAFDLIMGPYIFLPIYAVAFLITPQLKSRLTVKSRRAAP